MPFAELLQYRHCALRAADYWTLTPAEPTAVLAARLAAASRPAVQL